MKKIKDSIRMSTQKRLFDAPTDAVAAAATVANYAVGTRRLVRRLAPSGFVILEATGGLEAPVVTRWRSLGSELQLSVSISS